MSLDPDQVNQSLKEDCTEKAIEEVHNMTVKEIMSKIDFSKDTVRKIEKLITSIAEKKYEELPEVYIKKGESNE